MKKYEYQIGGFLQKSSQFSFENSFQKTFYVEEGGKLLKPLLDPSEKVFYEETKIYDEIIPKCHGTKFVEKQEFLILENLTKPFKNPCLMDIKLGTRSYDPNASKEKIAYEKSKYQYQEELGLRTTGMRVYDGKKYVVYDKFWGRKLAPDEFTDVFSTFFERSSQKVISELASKISKMLPILSKKPHLIIASSLLIIHEGEKTGNESDDMNDVRWIDFGHVFPQKKYPKVDDGICKGLKTILRSMKPLVKKLE